MKGFSVTKPQIQYTFCLQKYWPYYFFILKFAQYFTRNHQDHFENTLLRIICEFSSDPVFNWRLYIKYASVLTVGTCFFSFI